MLNKEQAQSVLSQLGAHTKYYATINIQSGEQGVTRFANSEINQNVSIEDTTVTLTLHDGKKEATCTTNVLSEEGLRQLVQDAEAILPFVPDGEFEAFPASTEAIEETVKDSRLAEAFDVTMRADAVRKGVASLKEGYTGAGALTLNKEAIAFGDNRGAFRFAAYDALQFNTVVTHSDGAAGGGACMSYRLEDVNIQKAFAEAQQKAEMARNPRSIDLGVYTVILSPIAFGDLMSFVAMPLCAKWIDDADSFAIGKIGQQVFGANINLKDDVHNAETRPLFFDYEGNRRQSLNLIEKGVVQTFLHDNKTAMRHQAKQTGHAVSNKGYGGYPMNLVMAGGDCTLDEMIADTPNGLFISEFHYTNYVNPRNLQITGLTRNGTYQIENGKLTHAISTMRFTQNLIEALNAVTALSKEQTKVSDYNALMLMPAARIEGFHFTSKP